MESIILLGLNLNAWITIATVLSMFTILLFTKLRADIVFLGAISILFLAGVLDAKETFAGFSSSSVVVIGAAVDCQESAGPARQLCESRRQTHAASGSPQLFP